MNRFLGLIILTLLLNTSYSQDTLPNFTLKERGNKVLISWYNPYETVIQLNIQRSFDSLTNFKTIFSPVSPELQQNGYSETKLPTNRVFYRLFYVMRGGSYFFTRSQRIGSELNNRDVKTAPNAAGDATGQITVRVRSEFLKRIAASRFTSFRDSVLQRTKDTLNAINDSLVVILPYTGPDNFRPSIFVFSTRDGVSISLPGSNSKRFSVKFFEENGSPIFEIQHVKEPSLMLDKANFYHAGWFLFELYEDDKLKEKNRFYLSRDF